MIINNFSCELIMLYYEGIDVSEGIDVNKASESKECLTFIFEETCFSRQAESF